MEEKDETILGIRKLAAFLEEVGASTAGLRVEIFHELEAYRRAKKKEARHGFAFAALASGDRLRPKGHALGSGSDTVTVSYHPLDHCARVEWRDSADAGGISTIDVRDFAVIRGGES